jgi:hypothetical protein
MESESKTGWWRTGYEIIIKFKTQFNFARKIYSISFKKLMN